MDEHMPTAADLEKQMREKEARLSNILTTATELIERSIEENGTPPDPSIRPNVSATYQEAHKKERTGLLSFSRESDYTPNAVMEITYNEHGYGDNRHETDQTYVISRTNDGDLIVEVSDVISIDGFNEAMNEANAFDDSVEGIDADPEMLATAKEDLKANVHDAISQEKLEADMTLHPATEDELMKLEEILTIAKDRTSWNFDDIEDGIETAEEHSPEEDDSRMSRSRKFARQTWRILTRQK